MEFKPAKCPSCQGDLQVPDDREFVKCMYCGTEIKVRESIILYNSNANQIPELLNLAKTEEKVFNWEKSDHYYSKVLEIDSKNSLAWLGKGNAVLNKTSATDCEALEVVKMIEYYNKAIEYLKDDLHTKYDIENSICSKISVELLMGIDVLIEMSDIISISIYLKKYIEALEYAKQINPAHIAHYNHSEKFNCETPEQLILKISTDMYHVDALYKNDFQNYYNKYYNK
jgi:tetratricopeptide (TPR) repeat protein